MKLKISTKKLIFRFRFGHAHLNRKHNDTIFIMLSHDRHISYGEILLRPYLTGETISETLERLENYWKNELYKFNLEDLQGSIKRLEDLYERSAEENSLGTFSGIDLAMHDLLSKVHSKPIESLLNYRLTQPKANNTEPVATIPFGSPGKVKILLTVYDLLGYKYIKIKTSPENTRNIDSIIAKRSGKKFILDANQSLDSNLLSEFSADNVLLTEDPLPMKEFMKEKNISYTPLLDEYIISERSLTKLSKSLPKGFYTNIRLAKNGGYTGAIKLINKTLQMNGKIYLGSLVGESNLLAYYSSILMNCSPVDFYEIGFNDILLKRPPFKWPQILKAKNLQKQQLKRCLVPPMIRKSILSFSENEG